MSIVIIDKSQDCSTEVVQVTVAVTQPTQFTLNAPHNVNAEVYFEGALVAVLRKSTPTMIVVAIGDYTVRMVGYCSVGQVLTSLVSDVPSGGGGGGGILTACASDDGRLILIDASVVPSVITELDGTPIGGGVTAVNCSSGSGGGGPVPVCASTDGRLILLDTSVSPAVLSELNGDPIGDAATAVACSGGSGGGGGPTPICASDDGRLILIDTSVVPSVITELDGTAIGGGVTAVACGAPAATFPDQTHALSHGTDINVPAGAKSVVITRLTGTVVVDGGFSLGSTPLPSAISYDASEVVGARGLLPAITMAGGTWQWSALLPITEE